MPSIEITAAQAAALARGENVTLKPAAPKPRRRYIIVFSNGNVYDVRTTEELPVGGPHKKHFGVWRERGDHIKVLSQLGDPDRVCGGHDYLPYTCVAVS